MIIAIVIAIVVIAGGLWAYHCERLEWNHGYCPQCGNRWRYFDTDSHGGRGYECYCCGNVTWISWFDENKDIVPEEKP